MKIDYSDEEDSPSKPYDAMDISCTGRVICAGSQLVQEDAYLVFWDQRNPKPLGGYWNSHTDDITQVCVLYINRMYTTLINGLLSYLLWVVTVHRRLNIHASEFLVKHANSYVFHHYVF